MSDRSKSPTGNESEELEQQLGGLALLGDRVRRAIYLHVVSSSGEVSRDDAAGAVGVSRSVASFHLDRLVEEGLLETAFRRLSGRSGPGAGRPSKLYRRSGRQLEVSLPPRRYELAARLLAEAVDHSPASQARDALAESARARGHRLGTEARARAGARAGRRRLLAELAAVLVAQGYEPELVGTELRLRNCPFHALVGEHTQLVCGMNLDLLEGVVDGLAVRGAKPVLAPRPGLCCVCVLLDREGRPGPPEVPGIGEVAPPPRLA
ncbi:MAG: helix-turn-helix transcriptional regulator [Thermoanaerobaculia bacterium]